MILASLCAVFVVLALLQKLVGIGRGYSILPDAPQPLDASLLAPLKQSEHALQPVETFLEIDQRTLFSADRAPRKIEEAPKIATNVAPRVPLNAQLTGVVITPFKRIALMKSTGSEQTFRVREGMPLPGELAGWRVVKIDPRKVIFDDGGDQAQTELKLDVAKSNSVPIQTNITPGAMQVPPPAAVPMPVSNVPPPAPDQAAREAEVQKIIEERRAQMRAEAERMSSGQQ